MFAADLFSKLHKFALHRKKLVFFGIIATIFFIFNIVLVLHCLDPIVNQQQLYELLQPNRPSGFGSVEIAQCSNIFTRDPLAISAFERMNSGVCLKKLRNFLCSLKEDQGWPVKQINNTCASNFDPSRLYSRIGCFSDDVSNRLLAGFKYEFREDNSIEKCVQACLRAGFVYAGVEYRIECFCGNSINNMQYRIIDDRHCQTYPCHNSSDTYCGGFNAISVYATGVIVMDKRMPKFVPLPAQVQNGYEANLNSVRILFVLQLNGRNSRQVKRLLKMIYRPKHLYYVHVDARQEYMFSEMVKVQKALDNAGAKNFHVAVERLSTIWGGSSLLDMFLGVIKWSFDQTTPIHWTSWDYVLNLSEADMPLLSMDELEYNLFRNMGMNFLSSHGYKTASFLKKQGFYYYFMECEQRMWRIGSKRSYPDNLRLDGGSDWVIVHRDLALYAISAEMLPQQIRQSFSTILLPLEGFFHTLALNSQFCTKVLYKNLRLTNWKRQQGCRCAALKYIVDWCGCSPLAIKSHEARFDVNQCQARTQFFGRKFDALIDVNSITVAEGQVLRFKRLSLSTSASYNSTWLNFYRLDEDVDHPNENLQSHWAQILFKKAIVNAELVDRKCTFQSLQEMFAYKAAAETDVLVGLVIQLSCGLSVQLLLQSNNSGRITQEAPIHNHSFDYQLLDVKFGAELDLKEEVFRDFTALVDVKKGKLTILWHWKSVERDQHSAKSPSNITSPQVVVQLINPTGRVVQEHKVNPYDSINYAQFVDVEMTSFSNTQPGIWTAKIYFTTYILAIVEFPVFPDTNDALSRGDQEIFEELLKRFFKILDWCVNSDSIAMHSKICAKTSWSIEFPDPKSEIKLGRFDEQTGLLL